MAKQDLIVKHFVDVGNFGIKARTEGSPEVVIRSLYASLGSGVGEVKRGTDKSPVVVICNGSDRKRYHFGSQARKYSTPALPIVLEDKTSPEVFIPAIAATLAPVEGRTDYAISLTVSTPDPDVSGRLLEDNLMGTQIHCFVNGVELWVYIKDVAVVREGVPAYQYADSLGLVPDTGWSVLVDIGGGTCNWLVFDEDGDIVGDPQSSDKGGCVELARLIASDRRLYHAVGDVPQVDIVMDGLANGTNRYANTTATWAAYAGEHKIQWFRRLMGIVRADTQLHSKMITRFIFTGGSCYLVDSLVASLGDFAVIIPQPELANVRGMSLVG